MSEVSIKRQIFESLSRASRILIPLSNSPSGDSLSAALAMRGFLKRLNKEPWLVTMGTVSEKYRFLPYVSDIQHEIEQSRGFVISVKTSNAPLDELSYHLDEQAERVDIFLKPKTGTYEAKDVSFKSGRFPYDLILVLGLPSLDLLGRLYDENATMFFETPIINIDHHPNNEYFGEINLVDITATSTTEILTELLEDYEAGLVDKNIATALLTGILIETNSFQHIKTTPQAFLKASSLISQGADQQEIVKHLYKTKSVQLLKLWGRALARLKEVRELGLAYSLLKAEDMVKAGSSEILEVMQELVTSLSSMKIIALLAESEERGVKGYVYLHSNLTSPEIANLLGLTWGEGNFGSIEFVGLDLAQAEAEFLSRLAKIQDRIFR
jgi:nanoRNase/pAp phosphatase (c-di-AMP/oligoRNAs hydrolase)